MLLHGDFLYLAADCLLLLFLLDRRRTHIKLSQLLGVDLGRRVRHHVRSALRLGERDDVADRAALRHEHDEAVETESDTAVRWRAVLEGVHHEAELLTRLFLREPDGLEDLLLQISLIDAQAAAADLDAVQNHVVSVRLDPSGVGHQVLDILAARRRERMVHGLPALLFLVVFKHREVRDPEEFQRIGIDEAAAARHLKAQFAERLCDDVCSLKPQEDRLCMSVIVRLDCRGEVLGAEVLRTAVRSKARLDYAAADRLLAGEAAPDDLPCDSRWRRPVAESLAVLDELASLRRERRARRGSIDFVTREAKVILDAAGHPKGVSVRERTRATSLVEEAMLLANESVAKLISDAGLPCAYRVHERPSPEELEATIPVLRELGLVRGTQDRAVIAGDPRAIRAVLEAARGTTGEVLANSVLLRAQKRAVYLPHNDGHYALAAPAYCHFTSPIRRYPDIIVHRALKLLLARGEAGRPGGERVALGRVQRETERILPQLCRTCSERERAADAVAHASQRVKMAELYAARVGEDFSGVVVGVERYGLFVMIEESRAEGLLSTRSLGSERFIYDESLMALTGEESGACWRPGRRIAVRVASVDVMQGQIDFALAGDASASGTPRRGRLH